MATRLVNTRQAGFKGFFGILILMYRMCYLPRFAQANGVAGQDRPHLGRTLRDDVDEGPRGRSLNAAAARPDQALIGGDGVMRC